MGDKYNIGQPINSGGDDKYIPNHEQPINTQPLSQQSTVPSDRKKFDSLGAIQIYEKSKDTLERANEPKNVKKRAGATGPSGGTDEDNLQGATGPSGGTDGGFLDEATGLSGRTDEDYLQRGPGPSDGADRDSSNAATGSCFHRKEPNTLTLPRAWESYRVKVFLKNVKNEHCILYDIDASNHLIPPTMQFLYKHFKEETEARLEHSFDFKWSEKEMHIICDNDPFKVGKFIEENDLLVSIGDCIEIDTHFEASSLKFPSSTLDKIYTKISLENPEEDNLGRVALYQGNSRSDIWVVGVREVVNQVRLKLSSFRKQVLPGKTQDISSSSEGFRSIELPCDVAKAKALGIQDYFDRFEFDVRYEEQKIVITGTEQEMDQGKQILEGLLRDTKTKQVNFSHLHLLDFNSVMDFCKKKVKEERKYCFLEIREKDIMLVSAASKDIEFIIEIIRGCVIDERVFKADELRWEFYNSEDFKNIEAKNKGNLAKKQLTGGNSEMLVLCTQDVNDIIQNELQKFLELHGTFHEKMGAQGSQNGDKSVTTKTNQISYSENKEIDVKLEMPEVALKYVNEYLPSSFTKIHDDTGVMIDCVKERNCIHLKGLGPKIKEAEKKLFELKENAVTLCEYVTGKTAFQMLIKPKDSGKGLRSVEKEYKCKIGIADGYMVNKQQRYVDHCCWMKDNIHIQHVEGNVTHVEADIVLCPVKMCHIKSGLTPKKAGRPILDAYEHQLKEFTGSLKTSKDLMSNIKGKKYMLKAVNNVHPFKFVGLILLEDGKELKQLFYNIFSEVIDEGYVKVAIPLMKGKNKQKIFSSCVQGIVSSLLQLKKTPSSPREIVPCDLHVYLTTSDDKTTECLPDMLQEQLKKNKFHKLDLKFLQKYEENDDSQSPISLEVVPGTLTDDDVVKKVGMIVNSVDEHLSFGGGISNKILKHAGSSFKGECPSELSYGEVVTTSGGLLPCKICHGVLLPLWLDSEIIAVKVLQCVVLKSMEEAEKNGCNMIAFPALGTGNLGYPFHIVSEVMINSVDKYGRKHPNTCIKGVEIVVWKNDQQTLNAFNFSQMRRKEFFNNPVFIELTPEIETQTVWLEAISNDKFQVKIQLFQKSAIKYEDTKLVVYITDSSKHQSQPTEAGDINHSYNIVKDHYLTTIPYNDRDFELLVQKCLNFTSNNRLLSVAFDVVAKDALSQGDFVKLAQTLKRIALNHRIEKVDIVKIYLDVDENVLDLCCKADHATESWLSLEKYKNVMITKVEWSKKSYDVRQNLTKAVKVTVAAGNSNDAKSAMICLQNMVDRKKQGAGSTDSKVSSKANDDKSGTANQGAYAEPTSNKSSRMQPEGNKSQSDKTRSNVVEVTPEVLPSKKVNVISRMSADVNPGILKLEAGPLEKIFKDLEKKYEVSITQSNGGCKIEGDCLNQIQKVKLYLENIGKENRQVMDNPDQSDSSVTDDFQNFISVPVSDKIKFQAYMHFHGDDLCRKPGIQMYFSADALIISGIALKKNDEMEKKIRDQVERINQMTTTDISFKREELQLMKVNKPKLEDEYKDGFFYIDEENLILFVVDDYNYEQRIAIKHRVKILLGQIQETKTRRNRRFAAGDIGVGQPEAPEQYNSLQATFSSEDHNTSFRNHGNGSNFSEKKQFTTKEGIIVYVYSQSILQLDVECIVNAANERLGHGAGVAAVIARAAGYKLEREGKDYIRQHGEIPVGECCHTTAGNLPYKYVIHTVGPRWNNNMTFDEQTQCKKELQNAVESCFYEADELGMRSIGVPSVSAGIFGMPPYICAKQYCEAVIHYSQKRTWKTNSTTLKEIHFIDMNVDMCRQIADVFSKCGELSGTEAGLSGGSKPSSSRHSFSKSSYSRSLSHGSYDSPTLSHSSYDRKEDEVISNSEEIVFRPCSWITIHLLQSSITEVKNVSVVVSPENLEFKHQGRISKDISAKADDEYIARLEIMKDKPTAMKSVFTLDCTEGMPWKHVVYAIAPRWSSEYVKSNQQFEIDLKDTMVNILSEVQMKGAKSLAVPLLGTAVKDMQTPVDTCCRAMLDGIQSIINKGTRAKNWNLDLWIVTTDPTAIHTFENMLDTKFGSKSPKTQQDAESSKLENKTTDDKALDGDCCICIDKITDPKWLPCKHVFCTDCIDQQFKFKPACPQCGAVHGIVTGDQPYGTMSRRTQHYSLSGYPECKTIAITYSFPAGYQTEEHPNPGKPYSGIDRTGYLPDNEKGRLVARLLRAAFDRRLVFTIGRSVTTGQEGVITWNDIHHKTRTHGGPQSFGYPDETYLDRVMGELAAKGVTEDSLKG